MFIRNCGDPTNAFAINLFFHDTHIENTNAFDAEKDGYLLSIPYSLINVDLFQRKVLTPDTYAEALSGSDIHALITWKIVTACIEDDDAFPELNAMPKIDVVSSILVCMGVAYRRVIDFDEAYIDNVWAEIEAATYLDETMYFKVLIDESMSVVEKFMKTYMLTIGDQQKVYLLDHIGKQYIAIAEMAVKMYPVEFHPEVIGFEYSDDEVADVVK